MPSDQVWSQTTPNREFMDDLMVTANTMWGQMDRPGLEKTYHLGLDMVQVQVLHTEKRKSECPVLLF